MPRTKQVRKKSSIVKKQKRSTAPRQLESASSVSSVENDELTALLSREYKSKKEFRETFENYYIKKVEVLNQGYENACEEVKKMIQNMRNNMPPQLINKNINNDVSEDNVDVENTKKNVPATKVRPSRSRTPDEAHVFKRPKSPLAKKGRTSSRKRSISASAVPTTSSNLYKTPSMNRLMNNSVITPKVFSDTPISMLRRPQHGEVAVSMSGSPLMVCAMGNEDIPTVNVPLQDGRVFSIIPEPDAPLPSDLPELDETTKQYLKTLRAHLDILAPNTP